jgi:hypothetical protein
MLMEREKIEPEYISRVDLAPDFWQFLVGLRIDDLVAELVQNDLDAGANRTIITFEQNRLICEGDGVPIDDDGWVRLSYLKGAGGDAPRKVNNIGVKNHGLKACFTIGDKIILRSDGMFFEQTLYKNGDDNDPFPGTFSVPHVDSDPYRNGCRIEVPYRERALEVKTGETINLSAPTVEKLETIFLDASRSVASRFIGCVKPHVRAKYLLELRHYKLGSVIFNFRAGRAQVFQRSLKLYNRTCSVSLTENCTLDIPSLKERCCLFSVKSLSRFNKEIPAFFKHKYGFEAEISWSTTNTGKPIPSFGRRRYPIEYAGEGINVYTGNCFNYSAPYVSDVERHGVTDSELNQYIDDHCRAKVITVLRYALMPQYGVNALQLLLCPNSIDNSSLKASVELLLNERSIPLAPKRKSKKKHRSGPNVKESLQFGPKNLSGGSQKLIALPVLSLKLGEFNKLLSSLCPEKEDQVHPGVPSPILSVLAGDDGENCITFDENDVFQRFIKWDADHFPWLDEEERCRRFSDPGYSEKTLDVINKYCLEDISSDEQTMLAIKDNALLPNSSKRAVLIKQLYAGKDIPSGLPIPNFPDIVHPDIANHPIFKKKQWNLAKYNFTDFLSSLRPTLSSKVVKQSFWKWLQKNQKVVPISAWPEMATLPIWPTFDGLYYPLTSLCKPRKQVISEILKDHIYEPHASISKINKINNAKKGKLKIRTEPTFKEVESFLKDNISQYEIEKILTVAERSQFTSFENEVAVLSGDSGCKRQLIQYTNPVYGLNLGGELRPVRELVRVDDHLKQLCLKQDYLLARKDHRLEQLPNWQARFFPTSSQILQSLSEDSTNKNALLLRLIDYLEASRKEGVDRPEDRIENIAFVPVGRAFCKPKELAFTSPKGDYWGDWKTKMPWKGLSADVQQNVYKKVGVLSGFPTSATSLAFFKWLEVQNTAVITAHMQQVFRQIAYKDGEIVSWCEQNPNVQFIPYKIGDQCGLASLSDARKNSFCLFIPDFSELEDYLQESNPAKIKLTITSIKGVKNPITSILKTLGVRSLKEKAGQPSRVFCDQECASPKKIREYLWMLQSRRMSLELRKRLDNLDMNTATLRTRWFSTLTQVKTVQIASVIRGEFKIYKRNHSANLESVFDNSTGIIWLKKKSDSIEDSFFSVIADLIFDTSEKYVPFVLQKAIDIEFRQEELIGGVEDDEGFDEELHGGQSDDDFSEDGEEQDLDSGEARQTHGATSHNSYKNIPNPGQISEGVPREEKTRPSGGAGKTKNNKLERLTNQIEKNQIDDLKKNHYAWHCQICLAQNTPEELAPKTSYVSSPKNRCKVIEASHVDQVHAGGARHVGNVLILCHLHHHYYGDQISRQDVVDALVSPDVEDASVKFIGKNDDGRESVTDIAGKLAKVQVPLKGEAIDCFFTEQHAEYWLEKSKE